MIRAAAMHAHLLLSPSRSYVKAAPLLALASKTLPRHGCAHDQMRRSGQDGFRMSLAGRWYHGSSEYEELAKKKCVPCNSKDIRPMSQESAKALLVQVTGWDLRTEGDILKLHKAWKVKNFGKGLEFLQLVATTAEAEGHHPDLHLVGWNNVKIDVWTHSVGGLTENDFILAAKINNLNLEPFLRKKAAA